MYPVPSPRARIKESALREALPAGRPSVTGGAARADARAELSRRREEIRTVLRELEGRHRESLYFSFFSTAPPTLEVAIWLRLQHC